MSLTFENPPTRDNPVTLTKAEIAQELIDNPYHWAVVARVDRAARATAMVERINSGREYGKQFEALARQVGSEHRVYARKINR